MSLKVDKIVDIFLLEKKMKTLALPCRETLCVSFLGIKGIASGSIIESDAMELVEKRCPDVISKLLKQHGGISSYHVANELFYDGCWTSGNFDQIRASGLYLI